MSYSTIGLLRAIAALLLITPVLLVIGIFISLGQYAQPSADDFCMAYGVQQRGLWNHLWAHYLEWSGRYSGNAFYAIYPLVFGLLDGYHWMPALLILALLVSLSYFVAKLLRSRITALPVLLISFCFVAVYLLVMKHTASSLYWMAGALSYLSANILFLLTLALLIELKDRQLERKPCTLQWFIAALMTVVGVGTNETNMLMLNAVMGLAVIFQLRQGRAEVKPWLLLWVVTLTCSAVVFFAPGNTVREASFALRHDWSRALGGSLEMGLWTLISWLTNPLMIVATLLTPFAVIALMHRSRRRFNITRYALLALLLFTLAIPIVLQFPAWWAMGGWPPPRTVDAIFFSFMLSWFLLIGASSIRFAAQSRLLSVSSNGYSGSMILLILCVAFAIALFSNGQFQRARLDLSERAQPYHDYLLHRYALIDDALKKRQPYLQVPAFQQEYPRSIYFNDIVPNGGDWRNVCYASYFGLRGISRESRPKTVEK